MRLTAVLAFAVLLSGCLASEETEIRVLREQGEPAIVTRGDKTLTEQARDEGILVKHRELSIRDNKIFGRETGIVENLTSLHIEASADGTVIRMKWDDSDSEIAETNGRLVKRDGETFVEWPKNATELRWKTHDRMKNILV